MLLAVVEGDPLFRLRLGRGQLAKIEQDGFQDRVGLQAEDRVWLVLGDGEELFRHFTRRLMLGPHGIKQCQPRQHREERPRIPCLLAQLVRLPVGLFDFRGGIAPGGHQRPTQGAVQHDGLLGALGRRR